MAFVLSMLMCWTISMWGQELETSNWQHKIGISFFEEHINLPFKKRLGEQHHYGAAVNIAFVKSRNKVLTFSHHASLGYFHHKRFFRAYFVTYKPTFSIALGKIFQIDIPLGLGYAHSFSTSKGYTRVDGVYEPTKSLGKPHVMPSIGMGATLKLQEITGIPIELLGRYEMFSLMPYAPKGSLPFTLHTSVTIGISYTL